MHVMHIFADLSNFSESHAVSESRQPRDGSRAIKSGLKKQEGGDVMTLTQEMSRPISTPI